MSGYRLQGGGIAQIRRRSVLSRSGIVHERVLLVSDTVARQGETGMQQAQPLLP
jgi:hypothetical protein